MQRWSRRQTAGVISCGMCVKISSRKTRISERNEPTRYAGGTGPGGGNTRRRTERPVAKRKQEAAANMARVSIRLLKGPIYLASRQVIEALMLRDRQKVAAYLAQETGEKPLKEASAGGAKGRHGVGRKPAGATSANRQRPGNAGAAVARAAQGCSGGEKRGPRPRTR